MKKSGVKNTQAYQQCKIGLKVYWPNKWTEVKKKLKRIFKELENSTEPFCCGGGLLGAFLWSNTKEGKDYWSQVESLTTYK